MFTARPCVAEDVIPGLSKVLEAANLFSISRPFSPIRFIIVPMEGKPIPVPVFTLMPTKGLATP